jgi:hypothetical protein
MTALFGGRRRSSSRILHWVCRLRHDRFNISHMEQHRHERRHQRQSSPMAGGMPNSCSCTALHLPGLIHTTESLLLYRSRCNRGVDVLVCGAASSEVAPRFQNKLCGAALTARCGSVSAHHTVSTKHCKVTMTTFIIFSFSRCVAQTHQLIRY